MGVQMLFLPPPRVKGMEANRAGLLKSEIFNIWSNWFWTRADYKLCLAVD